MLIPLPDDFGRYDEDWPTFDPDPENCETEEDDDDHTE